MSNKDIADQNADQNADEREFARKLMERRARALAQPAAGNEPDEPSIEVVSFQVGGEQRQQLFLIESSFVQTAFRPEFVSVIDNVHPHFVGVTNLTGQVLPVFDLAGIFDVPTESPRVRVAAGTHSPTRQQIVVLGLEQPEFGLLADGLNEVALLKNSEILESPVTLTGPAAEFSSGITTEGAILLNADSLLASEHLIVDQRD